MLAAYHRFPGRQVLYGVKKPTEGRRGAVATGRWPSADAGAIPLCRQRRWCATGISARIVPRDRPALRRCRACSDEGAEAGSAAGKAQPFTAVGRRDAGRVRPRASPARRQAAGARIADRRRAAAALAGGALAVPGARVTRAERPDAAAGDPVAPLVGAARFPAAPTARLGVARAAAAVALAARPAAARVAPTAPPTGIEAAGGRVPVGPRRSGKETAEQEGDHGTAAPPAGGQGPCQRIEAFGIHTVTSFLAARGRAPGARPGSAHPKPETSPSRRCSRGGSGRCRARAVPGRGRRHGGSRPTRPVPRRPRWSLGVHRAAAASRPGPRTRPLPAGARGSPAARARRRGLDLSGPSRPGQTPGGPRSPASASGWRGMAAGRCGRRPAAGRRRSSR